MKLVRIAGVMVRYRVALLLLPFFLLAPAVHGALGGFRWSYVTGIVALLSSYVVATCLNDVFDVEVDRVNHAGAADRPLVSGLATVGALVSLALVFAVVAIGAAAVVGREALVLILISLALNFAYSVPPVRLCARPVPAPLVLGFAYVVLPYGVGLAASGASPDGLDLRIVAAFTVLFVGRMLLKDFRDRRGDAAFGKRTVLLTYGKDTTLAAVLGCVATGDLMLMTIELPNSMVLAIMTQTFFAAIGLELYKLWRATTPDAELTAIARGARMGNAVVLTWLGFVLLRGAGAPDGERAAFVLAISAIVWFAFLLPASAAATPAASAREASAAEAARAS